MPAGLGRCSLGDGGESGRKGGGGDGGGGDGLGGIGGGGAGGGSVKWLPP